MSQIEEYENSYKAPAMARKKDFFTVKIWSLQLNQDFKYMRVYYLSNYRRSMIKLALHTVGGSKGGNQELFYNLPKHLQL